jgi:hypothetical protein
MARHARQMLLFSFAAFLFVLVFGTVRATGPLREFLDRPVSLRSLQAFHAHFDSLCWLGSAALGAVMWVLGDAWQGPRFVPAAFTACWMGGSVLFAGSFLARGLGEALEVPWMARGLYAILASLGGSLFCAVIGLGGYILLAIHRRGRAEKVSS